jgi:hypothetical protein
MTDDEDSHDGILCDLCHKHFSIYQMVVLPECGEVYCAGCIEEMVMYCMEEVAL